MTMTRPGDRRRGEAGIPPSHYLGSAFTSKSRFISYWHQLDELLKREAQFLLEVGTGNQFLTDVVRRLGKEIITADINPALLPDVVGSVEALPFADQTFDMVLACQVLEHLPFASLKGALHELHRVTTRWAVLSVPNSIHSYWLQVSVPRLGPLRYQREFPALAKVAQNPRPSLGDRSRGSVSAAVS
jgi:ubiquinone/menaquinone biosynthesis C-methylase UbiE